MLKKTIIALLWCTNGLAANQIDRGTLGVDMHFLLRPELRQSFQEVPGSNNLTHIIEAGARALDWVDILQKDVPLDQREQIWRRADRLGNEPTPASPMHYNDAIILERFESAMRATPDSIKSVLTGTSELPTSPPDGMTLKEVVSHVRAVHAAYSSASRWLVLYDWRFALKKGPRDLRGVLQIRQQREALVALVQRWSEVSKDVRSRFVSTVAEACPITIRESVETCAQKYSPLVEQDNAGESAGQWLTELLTRGERVYQSKFGVQAQHFGVGTKIQNGYHEIEMPTFDIDTETFEWIQKRVDEAWVFGGLVGVRLFAVPQYQRGAVRVRWRKGALPNVNGIGGDIITMDSNTPKWLEHTQTVMRHEMGHVLGFPDCYTEFWDEDVSGFTYYSLDPSDAMCALSGEYLDRHRDALLSGYFQD